MDSSVPPHQPGDIVFNGRATREETWRLIPRHTRRELTRRSGEPIAWIADLNPDGLPWAVTFGDRALAALRAGWGVFSFDFTPGSLQSVPIDSRMPSDDEAPTDIPADPPDIGLGSEVYDMLGNLPLRAQRLLQLPFLDGAQVMSNTWQYEGTDERLDRFMFYLAGTQEVTIATGTMVVPPGGKAEWSLVCYHATVAHTDVPLEP
jgi:hypothetical protein